MIHQEHSLLKDQTVTIKEGEFKGEEYRVEDWWDKVSGHGWDSGVNRGNPACLEYMVRSIREEFPLDNEVLYGKIGPFGKLIHISQIGDIV